MTSVTLDTNILIYSIDVAAGDRHSIAAQVIRRAAQASGLLTLQSISEFYAAATRKRLLDPLTAAQQAHLWMSLFQTVAVTHTAIRLAMSAAGAGQASYWDALLLATSAEAGCTAILTEDMADGATLLGVRIVNPFDGARLSPAAEALLAA